MKLFSEHDVLGDLRKRVTASTQKSIALDLGVSPQFLSDVLRGRRAITENLAREMGYAKVSIFYRKASNERQVSK